ncbi:hypothetical protein [Chitinophaga sp. S165]|uniref:hypothetical protein n=1 Tax=Chitinophaga sp. S165 TaxID=2135462 RepID=UPI000D9FD57A|nr:hypothetical protein [Chitinophaga sp. S165]PWV47140.1 hypothetical protein C7475_109228 [Chitinophaga sp. S165]
MAKITDDLTRNQVAKTVAIWDSIEQRFTNRYGKEMLTDPSYIKAKEQIFQQIIDQYKNKDNNFAEKAELRVLQAQKRAMIRQRYPNGFARFGRNTVVLSANLAFATLKLGWGLLKSAARMGSRMLTELSRPVQHLAPVRSINGGLLSESGEPTYGRRVGTRQPELKSVLGQAHPTVKNNNNYASTIRKQQPRRMKNIPATNKGKSVRH